MLYLRNRHLFLIDLVVLPAAALLAFVLRLNAVEFLDYWRGFLVFTCVAVPLKLVVFHWAGLYNRMWRYASIDELVLIAGGAAGGSLLSAAILFGVILPLAGHIGIPRSIPFIDGLLTMLVIGGPRFAIRMAWRSRHRESLGRRGDTEKRVLIIGAGDAGAIVVRELHASPQTGLTPVGFIDDDKEKHGIHVYGVLVHGGRESLARIAHELHVDEVIIAMPSAPGTVIREILSICSDVGVPARTVPGLFDIISGELSVNQIREVDIEDLLRRKPVKIDVVAVQELLRGRRVLVTGGGGSIGGELCRQITLAGPEQLIVLGHGENSVFTIYSELVKETTCPLFSVIADIRDYKCLERIFATFRPELVFHAAAHKHVPLMEANACEAITNNILGTRNLVRIAKRTSVNHFLLISTDKAVNPSSVMGVTKRIAELIVHNAGSSDEARFAAVRFGNVLGSRGSVVNIFKQQISDGGPVTVTSPEMKRYFMTIPEAVQLVLQAAVLCNGGEVFVLDMGEPVAIVDLATDLIRLSGFKPLVRPQTPHDELGPAEDDWDIEVVFSGVRPGEKLFEELFLEGENHRRTNHEKILVALNGEATNSLNQNLDAQVDQLIELAQSGDEAGVRRMLREIVPEYQPAGESR